MVLGGDGATAADPPDPPTHALWQHHYRRYKILFLRFKGGYVGCPNYSQRYPSSAGLTVSEAATSLTRDVAVRRRIAHAYPDAQAAEGRS